MIKSFWQANSPIKINDFKSQKIKAFLPTMKRGQEIKHALRYKKDQQNHT